MTQSEIQTIINKYQSGQSMVSIAREHFTWDRRVRRILVEHGVPIRTRHRPAEEWDRIVDDWNSGRCIREMAAEYGYAETKALTASLCRKRQEGYPVKYRRPS